MKRTAVVVGLLALVLGLGLWRCSAAKKPGGHGGGPTVQSKTVASGATPTIKERDPRKLQKASIAGTVTDKATKQPLAGARVCADGWSQDAPGDLFRDPICVDTDAKGAYRIGDLFAAHYLVSASAKSYRPGAYEPKRKKQSFLLAPGETKTGVDIALDAGGVEITGTVSDISGGPVAHALVRARAGRWGGGTSGPGIETDDKGHYALWVRPGTVTVTASADGYASGDETGQAPGSIDVLLTPESSLTGTVVDAATGAPIENARVSVQGAAIGSWNREGDRTDAAGKFRVHGLTPGRYVAEATTEHGYGRTEGSVLVGLGQHVDGVVVRVHPAATIVGKVVIKGAQDTVCEDGYAWLRDDANDRWASGRTDPDGTITIEGVLPGTYTPNAGCNGYANTKDKYDSIVVTDKDIRDVVWEVEPGATIKGKVLTKRGEPVADANINARSTGGGLRDQMKWAMDNSKLDGTYELDGLRTGTYLLQLDTTKGVAPRDGWKVDAPTGKTVEKDLVVDDGGRIEGTVVDDKGKPVADVKVDAMSVDNDWGNWNWDARPHTDATGKFVIDAVRPGDYRVVASRGWFETLRKPGTTDDEQHPGERVTVRAGETAKVRIVVEAQNGTIKGTVVDAEGKPVSDAFLSTARESDAAGAMQSNVSRTRSWDWGDDKPVLTAVDGSFTISNLSPGNYTLRAYRKGGGEAVAEHVAVGSTARLQIKHVGSIAGVAKRASGALDHPPDEITVELADLKTGFSRSEKYYKTNGAFTVHDLPQGHFELTITAESDSKKTTVDLAEGEAKTGVDVTLDSLVTITGRVVEYGTQKPVPGMRVFAQAATGGGFTIRWGGDQDNDNISDEAGRFTVKRVPRGQIAVQGMAKEWKDSDYTWFRAIKTIDGTSSTVDIGDVGVIKKRIKEGEPSGELGINFVQQAPDTPPDQTKLEVSFIDPAGPAAKSGIKVGDVITSVDGIDVTGVNSTHAWTLMNAPPGTKLALGLKRGVTINVVLAAP